jgi:2-polyprenyl-3-methyl-5-hydroxy-6-metoxy-1,4-benzoquinol methylase
MKPLDRVLQQVRVRMVRPCIAPGARLLDVGCADGALYRAVGRLERYVGVDPDAPASSPGAHVRFIRDVFPTSQLDPDEPFDVITATAVLEHIPRAAQGDFARACARHAVPGGRLAITVPAPIVDSILGALKRASLLDGMKEDEHYGFDPATTPLIFEPHGFRLEQHKRFEVGLNHLFVFRRT